MPLRDRLRRVSRIFIKNHHTELHSSSSASKPSLEIDNCSFCEIQKDDNLPEVKVEYACDNETSGRVKVDESNSTKSLDLKNEKIKSQINPELNQESPKRKPKSVSKAENKKEPMEKDTELMKKESMDEMNSAEQFEQKEHAEPHSEEGVKECSPNYIDQSIESIKKLQVKSKIMTKEQALEQDTLLTGDTQLNKENSLIQKLSLVEAVSSSSNDEEDLAESDLEKQASNMHGANHILSVEPVKLDLKETSGEHLEKEVKSKESNNASPFKGDAINQSLDSKDLSTPTSLLKKSRSSATFRRQTLDTSKRLLTLFKKKPSSPIESAKPNESIVSEPHFPPESSQTPSKNAEIEPEIVPGKLNRVASYKVASRKLARDLRGYLSRTGVSTA